MTLSESSPPRTTLTDINSSGLRHSDGTRAEWLARYGVKAIVDATASVYTTKTGPSAARTGAAASVATPRMALEANRTRSRGTRSAYTEMTGARSAAGRSRTSPPDRPQWRLRARRQPGR